MTWISMDATYLVRYGLMGHVGRFQAGPEVGGLARGEAVLVRTPRGLEMGEVLALQRSGGSPLPEFARVVRAAGPEDRERAERARREQTERLADCERVFQEGTWPILLLDVEILADFEGGGPGQVVVHYLGSHNLDTVGLRAVLRNDHGLDLLFEPAGRDADDPEDEAASGGCGSCGRSETGGCGGSRGGGCSSCAVKDLVDRRRQALHA